MRESHQSGAGQHGTTRDLTADRNPHTHFIPLTPNRIKSVN